jgi:L-lactate utilization protein LutB
MYHGSVYLGPAGNVLSQIEFLNTTGILYTVECTVGRAFCTVDSRLPNAMMSHVEHTGTCGKFLI